MKKLIPYLLVFVCLGCDDLFHEEEISIGKIESEEELESAVNGLYSLLAYSIQNNDGRSFMAANTKGDDITTGSLYYRKYYSGKQTDCWVYHQERDYRLSNWQNLYKIIISANNIIVQFDTTAELSNRIKELLGEAYFLRAYTYFRLTRCFGQIPLIKDIDIDYTIQLSSFEKIYSFIEHDLQLAKQLLSLTNYMSRNPFNVPHRGTAKALLAEVYLSWAGYPIKDNTKYIKAANEAYGLIDSMEYFDYGLMPDFIQLWEKEFFNNKETVFKINFTDPSISKSYNIVYNGNAFIDSYYDLRTSPDELFSIHPTFFPTEVNFYNNFPKSYRKNITYYSTIYVPNEYPYYPQIDTGYIYITTTDACSRMGYRKFYIENRILLHISEVGGSSGSSIFLFIGNSKIYLLRYAQTLLTYVEAVARSGQDLSLAYECINQIRRRANNVDLYTSSTFDLPAGLSATAFADSVVQERAWELAGEPEGRWFDLVRLERVEELEHTRHPMEGGFPEGVVTKDDYFFTIPEEELELNSNLINE